MRYKFLDGFVRMAELNEDTQGAVINFKRQTNL